MNSHKDQTHKKTRMMKMKPSDGKELKRKLLAVTKKNRSLSGVVFETPKEQTDKLIQVVEKLGYVRKV